MSLSITGIIAFARSPMAKWLGLAVGITSILGGAYVVIDTRAYARAERACQMAETEDSNQLLRDAIIDAEEAHQFTLAEAAKGDALSKQLSITQRKLDETKVEYLAYANAIVGNCPGNLGVLLSSTSPSNSEGTNQGTSPGTPPDSTDTVDAAPIGVNIALNRWAFETNYAQCSALLKWHSKEDVK